MSSSARAAVVIVVVRNCSAGPSAVPPELTDRIIDFLHDDWDSLKSCSLACKAWLPASRYHLWHRVVLRYSGDERDDYAEFLKSSPVITSCIADLTVEFPTHANRAAEVAWTHGTLLPIFSTLRVLRQLMFVNARFGADDVWLRVIAPRLSSLHALQLSLCSFSAFSQYVDLVWRSPHLETLRLDNVAFDVVDKYVPRPITVVRPKIKFLMLIFYTSHMLTVIDWLISENFCSHLDFLVVFQLQIESPAVTRLLPAIGSHLRHLSVSYAFLPAGTEKVPTENTLFPTISHCTHLRTLNFLFAGPTSLSTIPLVISQISSPHVEEIELGLADTFSSDDLDAVDWPSLWVSLTGKRFSRLRSVRLMVPAAALSAGNECVDTGECIRRHLSAVDTRGLIKVECVAPDHDDGFPIS